MFVTLEESARRMPPWPSIARTFSGFARLSPQLLNERLFHLCGQPKLSRGSHCGRVREDRLTLGKVDDGRKRLAGLDDRDVPSELAGGQRGRHAGHAPADDDEIAN